VWANLSLTDQKAQRKPIAEKLYKQGFTMEQIATQLGVTQKCTSVPRRGRWCARAGGSVGCGLPERHQAGFLRGRLAPSPIVS
jgi:hypothetical protein